VRERNECGWNFRIVRNERRGYYIAGIPGKYQRSRATKKKEENRKEAKERKTRGKEEEKPTGTVHVATNPSRTARASFHLLEAPG
jgi:hypothetical protein